MLIPINDHVQIDSDPLNWIVQARVTDKDGKLTTWRNIHFYGLNRAGGLHSALTTLMNKRFLDHPLPHSIEIEPLAKVVERLELVEQRLLTEFATQRKLSELSELNIAVEAAGYRFNLSDPYCVHRQVWQNDAWKSKNYFNSLGHALISTLHRVVRSSDAQGKQEALRVIYETEMALRTVLKQLPVTYFSAQSGFADQKAGEAATKPRVTFNLQPPDKESSIADVSE